MLRTKGEMSETKEKEGDLWFYQDEQVVVAVKHVASVGVAGRRDRRDIGNSRRGRVQGDAA